MNCIDMNAWYSRVDKPERPDYVVFDLDPPESRNGFVQAIRVAHLVQEALDALELRSYVKTSGADGIHVLVPIARRYSYPETYELAELVSRRLEAENPGLVTTEWLKKKRRGVLVDHRQNGHGKTIASAYSVRPKPGAPVSTPLRLGGARREGAAARLRHARGAGADREARRPVRARAPRRAGPGAGAALAARVRRAVVIGSGPNGLAAAITMARAGWEVTVHEAADTVGGGVRSEELTLPGFVHDVCSAIHPLGRESPFFRDLELPIDWVQPEAPAAHPLDDGTAVVTERSLPATAEGLGEDRDAYLRLFSRVVSRWSDFEPVVLGPFLPRPNRLLHAVDLSVTRAGLSSAAGLAKRFRSDRARALLAGHAAHSMLPLETRPSGGIGLFLIATAHVFGWGFPRGGAQRLADALADRLEELGGEIRTGSPVDELPRADAVLADVVPRELLRIAGDKLPAHYAHALRRYRHGPGVFKLDWALDGPIPWTAPDCRRAATVHLGGTFEEIAESERSPGGERPFVLLTQPSLFDDTRAPSGKHTAWAYCHVPLGSTEDMTERIEAQVERFAPGFRDPDPRAARERARRPRASQPEHRRRGHQRRHDGPPPALLPPGAQARPVPDAAGRPLPLLLVHAAGRGRPRHVRVLSRAHGFEGRGVASRR